MQEEVGQVETVCTGSVEEAIEEETDFCQGPVIAYPGDGEF